MNWHLLESIATISTPIVLGVNAWLTAIIRKDMADLRAHIYKEFVTLENFRFYMELKEKVDKK